MAGVAVFMLGTAAIFKAIKTGLSVRERVRK